MARRRKYRVLKEVDLDKIKKPEPKDSSNHECECPACGFVNRVYAPPVSITRAHHINCGNCDAPLDIVIPAA